MKKIKEFKIRCSAIGNIMTLNEITERQLETLNGYIAKDKLTETQERTKAKLIHKRDNPTLGEGAKTYCKDWLKGQLLGYKKMISSKYLDKGNICEDEAIDFIVNQLGEGFLIKNEDHFSDDYMMGTPDVITNDLIIDVKNSWDASTFPMFEVEIPSKDYYWQLQGYMRLAGRSKSKLIYTLMDTPDHLIAKEARWESIGQGFEEMEVDIYEEFRKNMTYKNVPAELKIKVFDIERNDSDIQKIKTQVERCREYIKTLIELS